MGIHRGTTVTGKPSVGGFDALFLSKETKNNNDNNNSSSAAYRRQWLATAKEKGALPEDVPLDPQEFYHKLGLIPHPKTRLPVRELADYQIDISRAMLRHKYTIVVKSQKSGITTSVLMTDLQLALLPPTDPRSCMGREILIVAQSADMARQHIDTLRQILGASETYSDYLITESIPGLNDDEVSKVEKLYVYNPYNHSHPTKIIGRGPKAKQLWSWKDVKHIHMSDIAIVDQLNDDTINSALARLANSDGTVIIETPPNGPSGPIYEIWNRSMTRTDRENPEGQFEPLRVTWRDAVHAGVISKEKIEEYKQIYGSEFPRYFEAEFIAAGGNVFSPQEIDRAEMLGRTVDYERFVPEADKSMGIDPGFGSSKFAIVVTQLTNGRAEVIYAREFTNSTPTLMLEEAAQMAQRYYVTTVFIDGSNPGYIRDLKALLNDNPEGWEHQLRELRKYKDDDFRAFLNRAARQNIRVLPISFGPQGKEMLTHAQAMLADGYVAIHPDFSSLLAQMRSATEVNRDLNKSSKNPLDLIDALRLNLMFYELETEEKRKKMLT